MKNVILCLLIGCITCAACADQYMVKGTSTVQAIEGGTLYLKVFQGNEMKTIDSTKVVHGRFTFRGIMDTTVLANLYLDEMSVMPLVLESGEVLLDIQEAMQSATGTPLNDSLSAFIRRKSQIEASLAELTHRESQMIMNGMDHDLVIAELSNEAQRLHEANEELVTRFIKQNYTNVLGPGIFMILTSNLRYPILNPQIEAITIGAPPYFLNNPYVKEFLRVAEENKEKLQTEGLK